MFAVRQSRRAQTQVEGVGQVDAVDVLVGQWHSRRQGSDTAYLRLCR